MGQEGILWGIFILVVLYFLSNLISRDTIEGNTDGMIDTICDNHVPKLITDTDNKYPTCMICSVEESVIKGMSNDKSKSRRYSRRKAHLEICSNHNCNIVAHTCCPVESQISKVP